MRSDRSFKKNGRSFVAAAGVDLLSKSELLESDVN
jgi:hypothetical protein